MLAEPLQSLIDEAKKVPDDSEPNEEYSDEISLEGNDSEREVNSETSEPAEQASD
jgi:hypothetical protein